MSAFSSVPKFEETFNFDASNVVAGSVMRENILTGVKQVVPGDAVSITCHVSTLLDNNVFIVPQGVVTAGSIPLVLRNYGASDYNPGSLKYTVKVF